MCYDSKAQPPFPFQRRGGARGADFVLTAADGNQFNAFIARPEQPSGAQVIVFPDVRGLHQFYKDLTILLAEAGYEALAIDYFGRTAGLSARDDAFEFMPHVQQMTGPTVAADLAAAMDHLAPAHLPIATMGFCMGGALSLISGSTATGLAGVIGFYAGLSRSFGSGTALECAPSIKVPVLGLFGGADPMIPADKIQELDSALDTAGVAHTIITYPNAPHSFFDRRWTDYAEASADAWSHIVEFLESLATYAA